MGDEKSPKRVDAQKMEGIIRQRRSKMRRKDWMGEIWKDWEERRVEENSKR